MKADNVDGEPTTKAGRDLMLLDDVLDPTKAQMREAILAIEADARADALDVLEAAWGIIANAGGGDWTKETQMWQDAAARWRDRYHAILAERQS